jgi:hypothetical protein
MQHAIPIDRLVAWAYIELLKRGTVGTLAQQWDTLRDYGERGWTAIDDERVNADLRMPAGAGPPHRDALTIERAVQGLSERVALDWPAHRVLILGELLELAPGDPLVGRTFNEVGLVETFARMGSRPAWDIGQPIAKRVIAPNHRGAILAAGKSKGSGRYDYGSASALRYEPSIERIAFARAEYFVWRSALERLAGTLRAWTLADHVPLAPGAPAEPWFKPSEVTRAPLVALTPAWPTRPYEVKRKRRQRRAPGNVPA